MKYAARHNPDGNFLDDGDGSSGELVEPKSSLIVWHIPTNSLTDCGTTNIVYIGFDHAKVKTRNLSRIPVNNVDEDMTEHCLGVIWADKGKIDLFSLLGSNYLPYKNEWIAVNWVKSQTEFNN